MIGAGPVAIAARVAGLALLLASPARGEERMPVVPEQLAFTRSIDVQDEDEFQTSLSAGHLRLPHERSTTVQAEVEYGVTDRVQAIVELPYGVRDPAGVTAASETAYYAVPELVWKPGKHLELLVAVPVGLTGAAADYGVIAGITVEIERLTGRGQRAD